MKSFSSGSYSSIDPWFGLFLMNSLRYWAIRGWRNLMDSDNGVLFHLNIKDYLIAKWRPLHIDHIFIEQKSESTDFVLLTYLSDQDKLFRFQVKTWHNPNVPLLQLDARLFYRRNRCCSNQCLLKMPWKWRIEIM